MARPRKNIDPELVRKLAGLGLTQRDIASFVGCSQSLISQRFSSFYDLGVTQSKKSLRALMWRQARGGTLRSRCAWISGSLVRWNGNRQLTTPKSSRPWIKQTRPRPRRRSSA